jgi:hypothetical protein
MPLADDPAILHRPIGFAVGLNRKDEIDPAKQRERLPGLLRFVRTFAGELLEKEFGTTLEGYPDAARKKTHDLRVRLRNNPGTASEHAQPLLLVLIDLMDLEIAHHEASPEDDPEEQEDFHDAILTFIQRLLDRLVAYAADADHLPNVAEEAERGSREFAKAAARLGL